jgi:predicted transcriptional regulator
MEILLDTPLDPLSDCTVPEAATVAVLPALPVREAVAFDYSSLAPQIVAEAKATAERIRSRIRGTYVDTGRDLLAMKDRLGHGRFTAWLRAEFQMSERTARHYMGAARLSDLKTATVAGLPPATVYALSSPSLPEGVRDAFLAKAEAGEQVTVQEVKSVANDVRRSAKAQIASRRVRGKKTPAEKKAALADAEQKRLDEIAAAERRTTEAMQQAVDLLVKGLGADAPRVLDLLQKVGQLWRVKEGVQARLSRDAHNAASDQAA